MSSSQHPSHIGKYTITGVLGEGAMGVVYQAFDPLIQRRVAIKTIRKQLMEADQSVVDSAQRFRNEAQAAGRLSHPGIVAIYDYGEEAEQAYIAMEYVEGHPLSRVLAAKPLLSEAEVTALMGQLLEALDYAHTRGVWHRDIKPANLILTGAGQLKITDFGIARIAGASLTQVPLTIGTPGYMAPEQYVGEGIDQRVDIFASGVLLYLMTAARMPFSGTAESLMYKILHEEPLPPSQVQGGMGHRGFDAVVAMAMAKDPARRYPSAARFRQALLEASSTGQIDMEATVVLAQVPPARPAVTPLSPSAPPASIGSAPTPAGSGGVAASPAPSYGMWDAATLRPYETALTSVIGPMAKVLVRQAARECGDMTALAERMAGHISDPAERAQFLKRLQALQPQGTGHAGVASGVGSNASLPTTPLTAPPAPGSTTVQRRLTPEAIERAQQVLTSYIGPIARVVVKRAAGQAASLEAFHQMLADQTSDPADKARLLKALSDQA